MMRHGSYSSSKTGPYHLRERERERDRQTENASDCTQDFNPLTPTVAIWVQL